MMIQSGEDGIARSEYKDRIFFCCIRFREEEQILPGIQFRREKKEVFIRFCPVSLRIQAGEPPVSRSSAGQVDKQCVEMDAGGS